LAKIDADNELTLMNVGLLGCHVEEAAVLSAEPGYKTLRVT
jgi:hypothetical protein